MVTIPMFAREKAKGLAPLRPSPAPLPGFDLISPPGSAAITTTISASSPDRSSNNDSSFSSHYHHHHQRQYNGSKSRPLHDRISFSSPKPFSACNNDGHADSNSFSIRSLLHKSAHHHPRNNGGAFEFTEEFQPAQSKDQEPMIPSPRVFLPPRHSDTPLGAPFLPTVTQCAIHLELLEVLWQLKYRVTVAEADRFDIVFGSQGMGARYWKEKRGWGSTNRFKKEIEWVEAERKRVWKAYVELAVERFEDWWGKMDAALCERGKAREGRQALENVRGCKEDDIIRWSIEATGEAEDSSSAEESEDGIGSELPENMLPPLDVLMVWYCYMLMPKTYYDNFDAPIKNILWDINFPWSAIHSAINSSNWTYNPSSEVQHHFTTLTSKPFDLTASLLRPLNLPTPYPHPVHTSTCPDCSSPITLPLTDPLDFTGWSDITNIFCRSCKVAFPRSQLLKHSPLGTDLTKTILTHLPFWDEMHHHLWLRSPALSGKAYWGDIFLPSSSSSSSNDAPRRSPLLQPAGTLERAITRLRDFILSRGNVTSTSLPPDVDLVWRTLAVSPPLLTTCHPELSGKRLITLASCKQINVDRKKAVMNAKRYGPSEWERCLCWLCEATRTEKDALEREMLLCSGRSKGRGRDAFAGSARREFDVLVKLAAKRKCRLLVEWFAENEDRRRRRVDGLLDAVAFAEELRFVDGARNW